MIYARNLNPILFNKETLQMLRFFNIIFYFK